MRSLAGFAIVAGLVGCGGGESASPAGCPAFTRIVAGDFALMNGAHSWTMEVAQMPATFALDQTAVPDNQMEYEWAVELDADQDGRADLEVSLMHFRFPGTQQATVKASQLVVAGQENLWSFESDKSEKVVARAEVTISGNVFGFRVLDAADPRLALVTTRAQATWKTRYQFGPGAADLCVDSLSP